MMVLKDATVIGEGEHRILRGAIYGDTRKRFEDGEYVITSRIIETKGNIYRTKNSTYRVELAGPVKAVWAADSKGALTLETAAA